MSVAAVGTFVHVGNRSTGQTCRPALVLAWGPAVLSLRIFGSSERERDEWGDVRHESTPIIVPNPDAEFDKTGTMIAGTTRQLDSWHHLSECTE